MENASRSAAVKVPAPAPAPPPGAAAVSPPACLNCGSPVARKYCAECGQSTAPVHTSLFGLLHEFFEDFFHLDGKLARTFVPLLNRPGFLTKEYWAGRRARYVGPFRVYLVASVLAFALASFESNVNFKRTVTESPDSAVSERPERATAPEAAREGPGETAAVEAEADSDGLEGRLNEKLRRIGDAPDPEGMLRARVATHLPKLAFALLPVFAALLAVFFRRQGLGYPHHFVFGLHFHAFVFLMAALQSLTDWKWLNLLIGLSLPGYLFLALRHAYGFTRESTLIRFAGLTAVYFVLFASSFVTYALGMLLSI